MRFDTRLFSYETQHCPCYFALWGKCFNRRRFKPALKQIAMHRLCILKGIDRCDNCVSEQVSSSRTAHKAQFEHGITADTQVTPFSSSDGDWLAVGASCTFARLFLFCQFCLLKNLREARAERRRRTPACPRAAGVRGNRCCQIPTA